MMSDPSQFIQSLDSADPAVILQMTNLVNKMISDGEEVRKGHVNRQESAQQRFYAADQAHQEATVARDDAAGLVKNQEQTVGDASSAEAAAKDIRDDKKNILDAAILDEKKKADHRAKEENRIDAERDLLEQIIVKLQTLLPVELVEGRLTVTDYIVGRNLLSDSNADRDSVQKVVDKINAMVDRGEKQRQ